MNNVVIYDKIDDIKDIVEYYGGGILNQGCVKSVQRGDILKNNIRVESYQTASFTIPISTVNTNKAYIAGYVESLSTSGTIHIGANLALSNANTITITLYSDGAAGSFDIVGSWQVVEFY